MQAQAPQAPQAAPAPQPSASLEAASALERAIAALRAGQVPTSTTPQAEPFHFQTAPQPETLARRSDANSHIHARDGADGRAGARWPSLEIPMAVPMDAPEPHAETYPDAGGWELRARGRARGGA